MAMDEKLVERLIGCVPFDVEDSRTIQEAAQALTLAQARIRELEAKVQAVQSDSGYIIGFNTGWDEAAQQALRFPTMLRKMWTGDEVQRWIDQQMSDLRARQALKEASE